MTPERWHQIEELYQGALDLAAHERPAYLERACGHDTALRQEIDSLLATHDEAPSFLETPLIAWPPDEPLMPPETHVGPYKLLRPLGRGGMGQVYLATRAGEIFRQYVALKVIRRGLDTEDILRRFRAEQQILATLHHAHIAHLIDGGVTDDGQSYLVMEYVEGTPITTYCDGRQMTLEERVLLFSQVCEAVHHAHRNLVVHRDLKPSNILVTAEGVPKLLDFGIAKLLDPVASGMSVPTTQADGRVMTPEYASPEQVRGETITTASDVYALGVLLYELLVGRRPYHFERRTPQEIERVICEQEPEPPSAVLEKAVDGQPTDGTTPPMKPDEISTARGMTVERLRRRLNGDLDTIVLKALRKEPERRYASAQQLAEDLGRYLAGLPVLARPDTATYRAQKFVRRHRVGVAMTLIVVSLLLSFSVVSAVQSAEIRAKAEDVAQERDRAEEVIEFLVALFETPDPKVSKGNTVTARELLETGAARVEADLKEQPEVQADMMTVMSRVYRSLGLYDPAEDLARRALTLQKQLYGDSHLKVAESTVALARVLHRQDKYEEAEALYQAALHTLRKVLGEEDASIAATLSSLSMLKKHQNEYDAADSLLRATLDMQRRVRGNEHPETAQTMQRLGLLLKERGRYDEAEPLLREALATQRKLLGSEHPHVITSLTSLALMLKDQGDYAAAEPLLREGLDLNRKMRGREHPSTVSTQHNLARLLHDKGDYAAAEPLLREGLDLNRKQLGDEHTKVATSMQSLGWLLHDKGDYEEAESLIREALAMRRRLLGNTHTHVAQSLTTLAMVYRTQEDYAAAEPLYREALALYQNRLGDEHPYTAALQYNVARVLHAQKKTVEAERLYREALTINRNRLTQGHPRTAQALLGLGALLREQGRAQEAEPLLREALESQTATFGDEGWQTALAKRELGACLTDLQQFEEAEPLLVASYTLLKAERGPESKDTMKALDALSTLYEASGQTDKAVAHRALQAPSSR